MSAPISDIPVAILAGGLATRLRPLTDKIPKLLVPVAGKPFFAHQLELLRERGICRVVVCLGYLGNMVVKRFGDGHGFGMHLDYSFDGSVPLGTGGAIRHALPKLGDKFFVLYGDSYLTTPFGPIAEFFVRSGKPGLMTVYRNEERFDTSNIVFADGEVKVYDKKIHLPEMRHIDYGLSLFRSNVFEECPAGQNFDLADVMQRLVNRKQLAGYEVAERFYEVGSPVGLAELNALLRAKGE